MEQRRSACDTCRRRRVRCDSTQPCNNCIRNGITCTYGSVAGRQSATSYARNLEQQVAQLQRQLQDLTSHTSVTPTNTQPAVPQQQGPAVDLLTGPGDDYALQQPAGVKVYRYSAALNVLRTIANMLDSNGTSVASLEPPGHALLAAFETPIGLPNRDPLDWLAALLPPKETVWKIIVHALDVTLVGHDCIDRRDLRLRLDGLFDAPQTMTSGTRRSFLALVYGLLALGERYGASYEGAQPPGLGERSSIRGLNFFRASRCVVHDEHNRVDLDSVTAMMLHARYLLTMSTLSDAHAALAAAISAAMHMGLHLDDSSLRGVFTEQELYNRRRLFAVINMMETYLTFHLGLPRSLGLACPKQTLGLSTEDLIDEGQALIARDATSPQAETVLSQKLLKVYAKIHEHQYNVTVESPPITEWITEIEAELGEWETNLPELPKDSMSSRVLLGQMILRMYYTGAQIMLYSPWLHHLARDRSDPAFSIVGFGYGSACIRAATHVVFILQTLHAHDLLYEAHWLSNYLLAWAATILAYFVIHSRARVTIAESRDAALLADSMLKSLGETNIAAKHIHECIAPHMTIISTIEGTAT